MVMLIDADWYLMLFLALPWIFWGFAPPPQKNNNNKTKQSKHQSANLWQRNRGSKCFKGKGYLQMSNLCLRGRCHLWRFLKGRNRNNPLLSTRHWPERSVDTFFCQEVQRQRLFCIISIFFIYIIHGSSQKHLKKRFFFVLELPGSCFNVAFQRKKRINSPRRHEVTILPISWLLFGSKGISCATTNLDIWYNRVNKRDGPPDFFFHRSD